MKKFRFTEKFISYADVEIYAENEDDDIEWCNLVRKKIDNLMIKC